MHAHASHASTVARLQSGGVLDPIDRFSELLFGLIMALTFTCTLGVVADAMETRTMVVAALGCNLAWGIIDAGLYLMTAINEYGRKLLSLRALRSAPDAGSADRVLAAGLPPLVASVMSPEQLAQLRQQVLGLPETPDRPRLTRDDWLGALAVLLITFLSTFPLVIPFMLIADLHTALRVSNAIAIAMLFLCGWAFAHRTGLRPLPTGVVMVLFGCALVAIAIALGG
jgi:hypothetical protein